MLRERDDKLQPEERYGDGEDAVDERLQAALISCLKLHLRLCEFGFRRLFGHTLSLASYRRCAFFMRAVYVTAIGFNFGEYTRVRNKACVIPVRLLVTTNNWTGC